MVIFDFFFALCMIFLFTFSLSDMKDRRSREKGSMRRNEAREAWEQEAARKGGVGGWVGGGTKSVGGEKAVGAAPVLRRRR